MRDKSSEILIIIIFLVFAIISAFLIVFFLKRNIAKETNNYSSSNKTNDVVLTTEATTTIDISQYTTTTSNLDNQSRTYYNMSLKSYVEPLLASLVVDKDSPNLLSNVNYNTNMLNDPNFAYSFILYLSLNDNIAKEKDINGEGIVSYDLNEFTSYYNKILNKTFDINSLKEFDEYKYPTNMPSINGNRLYANYNKNYKDHTYMDIKAVNKTDDTIEADIIVFDTIEEYNRYSDPSVIEYPSDLIYTKVEITYFADKIDKIEFRKI